MDSGDQLGGGFGRRRSALMGAPAQTPVRDAGRSYAFEVDEPTDRISPLRLAAIVFGALLTLLCIEALFSSTSLITPIDATFLNAMRLVGFALGIPLAILTITRPHEPMGIAKKILILLFLPFLTGFAGGEAAWRISDWTEFAFSSAAYEPAAYPIQYASHGRKGRRDSFEIDPYDAGESTDIAVPSAQFDAIWPDYDGYCITVMQRKSASGAIEIVNDGVFTLREPAPAVLTRCGAEGSSAGDASSPWDKK
jgi:hypothetical protein